VLTDKDPGQARIALIDVRGLLIDARKPSLLGEGSNPVDRFIQHLALAEADNDVKAVVVRINSPGGTVTSSDIMHRELRRFMERSKKPVVVSLGEIAASGGYYLAIASDHIIAEPTTVTGSIGVIMPTFNFSEGLNKIGIRSKSVKSAANKDMANPFEPIRDGQYEVLQGLVDEFFARFKALVLERRTIDPANVATVTDGRVFTGQQALKLGLVDELGGVREAFHTAKKLASLDRAAMVKYSGTGNPARTAYSLSETPAAAQSQGPGMTLRMDMGGPLADVAPSETSGLYYLWMPAIE
jgi:protease-4